MINDIIVIENLYFLTNHLTDIIGSNFKRHVRKLNWKPVEQTFQYQRFPNCGIILSLFIF